MHSAGHRLATRLFEHAISGQAGLLKPNRQKTCNKMPTQRHTLRVLSQLLLNASYKLTLSHVNQHRAGATSAEVAAAPLNPLMAHGKRHSTENQDCNKDVTQSLRKIASEFLFEEGIFKTALWL